MSIAYLNELKNKCPRGHFLAILSDGAIYAVRDVRAQAADLEPVSLDLKRSKDTKRTVTSVKVTNFWYFPESSQSFGKNSEVEA